MVTIMALNTIIIFWYVHGITYLVYLSSDLMHGMCHMHVHLSLDLMHGMCHTHAYVNTPAGLEQND